MGQKTLKNAVVLIYANKTDYNNCMSLPEIVEWLDVRRLAGDRRWLIQKTCAISGQGLKEGLEWLCWALESKPSWSPSLESKTSSSEDEESSSEHKSILGEPAEQ